MYSDSNFTTILAGEDLSDSEGCAVVAAGTVSTGPTDGTGSIVGIVVRGAASGLPILIQGSGYGLVKANAVFNAGLTISATTSGLLEDATLTNGLAYHGVALEASSAQNHLIKALISIGAMPTA